MPDGRLWFSTKIDNSQIRKDLKQIETEIRKSQEKIASAKNAKLPLATKLEDTKKQLDEAEKKLEQYQKRFAGLQNIAMSPKTKADYQKAIAEIPQARENVDTQQKAVDSLKKEWQSIKKEVADYDEIILKATNDIERNQIKAAELSKKLAAPSQIKIAQAMEKADKSAQRFGRRLLEIGKSALIFNLLSSGLRSAVSYMGTALKTNSEYTAQLARLKGALLTAFQPIYEFILPGLISILKVLTAIVQVVANVLSFFSGKTAAQSAKNAKALYKQAEAIGGVGDAAEEASKQLLGFDEINRLESTDVSTGSGGGSTGISPDFSNFDTEEYKAKIDRLTAYISGALLALGAILAFSGANIPLGIALMAVGALGLATVAKENWSSIEDALGGALGGLLALISAFLIPIGAVLAFSGVNIPLGIALMAAGFAGLALTKNVSWGAMDEKIKNEVTGIMSILGGALLVMGAILAFSGANIPLGIAMMAIGGFALATAASLNWNGLVEALRGPIGQVVAIASTALLALGLILAFSGANIPLGIALIGAGAVGLVTVGAINWNALLEKCQETWGNIQRWFNSNVEPKLTVSYWQEKFSGIAEGLKQKIKDGVNGGIAIFNSFISWINNAMHFSWGSFSAFGQTIIPAGSLQLFSLPNIPYLAQGAVIPPNAPFMAVLGDQRNGTNIEAPLETIKQALAEVMAQYGGGDVKITFTGELAALGKVLAPVVTKAQRDNSRGKGT